MSDVIKFGDSSIVTDPGLESVNRWLFSQFSDFVRYDNVKVSPDSFAAKILEKQLKEIGFTDSHAKTLLNNLDVIFTEIKRTALVVGEAFQVGILGLVYGKTTTNDSHALTMNVIYEDWENLPFIHSFLITDVGAPGDGQDYLSVSEARKKQRSDAARTVLRTNDETRISQASINAVDLYFAGRTDSPAGYYEISFGLYGLSDRMIYNNAAVIEENAFLMTDHFMFTTGLTSQYIR